METTIAAVTVLSIEALKAKISSKENVVGLTFINSKGAQGTVLPNLSEHGKRQAEMTCTGKGGACTETHFREQSDWHQSYQCRSCKKGKTSSSGSSTPTGGGLAAQGSITKADGTVLTFQALSPGDTLEQIAAKTTNNEVFEAERVVQRRAMEAARALAEKDRKEKQTRDDAQRKQARAVEKKAQLQKQLKNIHDYAKKYNVCVNDVSVKALQAELAENEKLAAEGGQAPAEQAPAPAAPVTTEEQAA